VNRAQRRGEGTTKRHSEEGTAKRAQRRERWSTRVKRERLGEEDV